MINDPIRWGIIATGGIARDFTREAQRAGIQILGVASRSTDRADAFAREYSIPRSYGSTAALLADPDIDVVHIGTPHPSHAEIAVAALRAGKHVLVEKPFATNRAEAAEIAAVASETGLLAQEAMKTRFLPHMSRVRELVRSGALGQIRSITADLGLLLPEETTTRILDPESGGGALFDLGAYPVAFAWDVLGAPTRVHAVGALTAAGMDRQASMILEYRDGAQALLHVSLDGVGPNRAAIVGTDARIEIDPVWMAPATFRHIATDGDVLEAFSSEDGGTGLQYEALAVERALRAGRTDTVELPVAESVEIMGTLDALRDEIRPA